VGRYTSARREDGGGRGRPPLAYATLSDWGAGFRARPGDTRPVEGPAALEKTLKSFAQSLLAVSPGGGYAGTGRIRVPAQEPAMSRLAARLAACSLAAAAAAPAAAQETLSYADLVGRLVDLERLAVLPAEGERGALWSSWDRSARYDAQAGAYVQWEANGDGDGRIRMEGDAQVLAEMDGPGVIWRIWSAKPEQGRLTVLLDGEPALDMPFAHYFDAKHEPFVYPTLGYESARGKNLYVPIPYQRSCKVLARKGWGKYYQITYATFPKGTQLPRFSLPLPDDAVAALKRVDTYLAGALGTDPAGKRAGEETVAKAVRVAAGKTETVADLKGPRAVTALRVKAAFRDREDEMAALRQLVLRITWDGAASPAVWCPLGDFFGTAPGVNAYRSLPAGMSPEGGYSLWYMPFAASARIELLNDGTSDREAAFEIVHAPLTRPVDRLGRFHAKWHRDLAPLPKDRWPDWTVVQTTGRGRFCGMMLHVWSPRGGQCPPVQWCNGHWWWGEGDEKFFVDGEKFPSTFGTGTEDYFGYAWGNGTLFARAFHNQTLCEGNAGHISLNRWQIADDVPFQTSFEAALEKYWPNDWPALYAAVAYWYLSADGKDPHGPTPAAERHGYYVRPPTTAGGFTVLKQSRGRVQTQDLKPHGAGVWTDDNHLWWTGAQPGDTMDVAVKADKAGTYDVSVVLTKAVDYAIVQFRLDGRRLGDPIDLYNDGVVKTPALPLGTVELAAGDHVLTVEIVGANEKAQKGYRFGMDELKLQAR